MADVSPLLRSNGPLVVCAVVVVVIAGCEAQPIKVRVKETRRTNLSAVDFMRVCLATVVPAAFTCVRATAAARTCSKSGTM